MLFLLNNFTAVWKQEFGNKRFRILFITTIICFAVVLFLLRSFLQFNETREGVLFSDPLLELFNPVDVTWFTFGIIYIALFGGILYLCFHPINLSLALLSYVIMALFRICVMYVLPLDPPETTIPLIDPFVEFFGGGETLVKDLFFSGHTATMLLLFLAAVNPKVKLLFIVCTILVGIAVLIQHVHYTVDVLAAPFFAYTSYRIARLITFKVLRP